jgi:hypothetical protein
MNFLWHAVVFWHCAKASATVTDISWSAISDVSVKLKSNFFANGYIADGYFQALQNIQALQNMPRQNIGQKKLRKKKKKNTQVIYLGWIVQLQLYFNLATNRTNTAYSLIAHKVGK